MNENAPRFTHAEIKMMLLALDAFKPLLEEVYSKDPYKEYEEGLRLDALEKKLDMALLDPPDAEPEESAPTGPYFKNRRTAYQWLREHGLKMGQTTFYENIGKPGFPSMLARGRLSREDCARFLWEQMEKGNTVYRGDLADIMAWRLERTKTQIAEFEAETARNELAQFEEERARKNSADWIRREEAFRLYQSIEKQIIEAILTGLWDLTPALIRRVEGDESRAPDVCKELEWALLEAQKKVGAQAHEAFFDTDEEEDEPPFAPPP